MKQRVPDTAAGERLDRFLASLPEVGARCIAEFPAVAADLTRIDAMWTDQLAESGGPFLFGAFSAADAYFAPVCMRVRTYALPVPPAIAQYIERVCALSGVRAWIEGAL